MVVDLKIQPREVVPLCSPPIIRLQASRLLLVLFACMAKPRHYEVPFERIISHATQLFSSWQARTATKTRQDDIVI